MLKGIGAAVGAVGLVGCGTSASRFLRTNDVNLEGKRGREKDMKHPNILFVLTDDLGWMDMGCYWHPVLKTPHLDRLAAEGCLMTNFYGAAPICSPSRAGCLTGRIQARFGMEDIVHPGQLSSKPYHHLPIEQPTFARTLRDAGYFTGHIGKWHLTLPGFDSEPRISDYGFDYYCTSENRRQYIGAGHYQDPTDWLRNGEIVKGKLADWTADLYAEESIRFMEAAGERPFLLNLWVHAPHEPIVTAPEFKGLYAERPEPEQTYFGCVTQLDAALGRIFGYLQEKNLDENTIIIFTSDNGPEFMAGFELPNGEVMSWGANSRGATPFRDRKHDLHEGGLRVPALIRWPGETTPGSISHVPVSLIDLYPTFCAMTGAPEPTLALDGGDLRPALKGQPVNRPHPLYWQFIYAGGPISHRHIGMESPQVALRDGAWKLMCDMDYSDVRLYNLDVDPSERWNFAKGYPDVTARMMTELKRIHSDVNKPYPTERYLNPEITQWMAEKKAAEKP